MARPIHDYKVGPLAGARASGRLLMECLPRDTSLAGTNASLYSKINRWLSQPNRCVPEIWIEGAT